MREKIITLYGKELERKLEKKLEKKKNIP